MSQDIIREVDFFLYSVLAGIAITFLYDGFLIFRKLLKHSTILISIEDFLFWAVCGVGVFYMLHRENNGILRWFAVFGAAFGMLCYKLLFSRLYISVMSTLIHKIMWFAFRVIQVMLKPLKWLILRLRRIFSYLKKKEKKGQNFVKKKLTVCIKLLKMVLCKQ